MICSGVSSCKFEPRFAICGLRFAHTKFRHSAKSARIKSKRFAKSFFVSLKATKLLLEFVQKCNNSKIDCNLSRFAATIQFFVRRPNRKEVKKVASFKQTETKQLLTKRFLALRVAFAALNFAAEKQLVFAANCKLFVAQSLEKLSFVAAFKICALVFSSYFSLFVVCLLSCFLLQENKTRKLNANCVV